MAHWYFHLITSTSRVVDEEGREARDLASAQALAVGFARFEMSRSLEEGRLYLDSQIDVASEGGEVVSTVRFIEAFRSLATSPPDSTSTAY